MIFMYTVVLLVLGLVKVIVARRAAYLEGKYVRAANDAARLAHLASLKPGNASSSRDQWAENAKRQYELGQLVLKRDRLETKHYAWQLWADRLARWVSRVRHWKGQKLPYTMGVLDVWLVLYGLDYLGFGQVISAGKVLEYASSFLSR